MKKNYIFLLVVACVAGIAYGQDSENSGNSPHPAEPEMMQVQGGTFLMGCGAEQQDSCDFDEIPLHSVTLSSFSISKYEITQAQWKLVMGYNPSYWQGDSLPVENVSWNEVQTFISRLNAYTGKSYRLPTEAEWEFVARGGTQSAGYKYSGSNNLFDVAWCYANSGNRTHIVGTKKANELGIYDMNGNVWEWCQDWKGAYLDTLQSDPTGPQSSTLNRVYRGGGWNLLVRDARLSYRSQGRQSLCALFLGFRLAHP